ncbi:MAG: rhamnulokinase [Ewingella sp.]
MTLHHIAAIDLGASSGRVMLATFNTEHVGTLPTLELKEVHRFPNCLKTVNGHDTWDLDALEHHILTGLKRLDASGIHIDSIGVDTWGVDFVLLDKQGKRVGLPVAYRDKRTDGVMASTVNTLGREAIYRTTGIQFLSFNTLYQLKAFTSQQPELTDQVEHLLLVPDYIHYRLTGALNWEHTNASTTQMVNLSTGDWDDTLLRHIGVPRRWLGKPSQPGKRLGNWTTPRGHQVPVLSVATHDTASAVVAAPMTGQYSAYLSSGTWSLMGIESPKAFTHASALQANFTNEGGINGSVRVLKNIMGLWLLQRMCGELNVKDLPALIAAAAGLPPFISLINPNEARFINPPSMVDAIRDACREHAEPVPQSPAELARCIFDSLAMLYRQTALQLAELQGAPLDEIHIVGGGSQNAFLNQLCADTCQTSVTAGPVEASTLGNIGCQLMALNLVENVTLYRQILATNFKQRRYLPQPQPELAIHWRRFQALSHANEELTV